MRIVKWLGRGAIALVLLAMLSPLGLAQTEVTRGKVMYRWFKEAISKRSTTLSVGTLAQLQTDPGFAGDYVLMVNSAATMLKDYVIVNRGGYFPENRGIPREKQLTFVEAVYRTYVMSNGNELVLFRSPSQNTAEYVIRRPQ